jgi:ferrous iron transport protein A
MNLDESKFMGVVLMDTVMSLDMVREGARVVVKEVSGGGWARRLYQMGIVPGSQVEVVFNRGRGPVVVRVGGVEVSIGRGIARRILIQQVTSP